LNMLKKKPMYCDCYTSVCELQQPQEQHWNYWSISPPDRGRHSVIIILIICPIRRLLKDPGRMKNVVFT
jgi:hypothetical protein